EVLTLQLYTEEVTSEVTSLSFSPDGKRLVTGGRGHERRTGKSWGEVRVWDLYTGVEQLSLKGHTNQVFTVVFSPDGKRIASGGWSGGGKSELKVWDAQTGREQRSLKGPSYMVRSVCFSPDGKRIAAGGGEPTKYGEVKVWDTDTGLEVLAL